MLVQEYLKNKEQYLRSKNKAERENFLYLRKDKPDFRRPYILTVLEVRRCVSNHIIDVDVIFTLRVGLAKRTTK